MNRFEANVFWLSQNKLKLNKKYDLKINTGQYHVNINEIKKLLIQIIFNQRKILM